ncbi:MAG: LemA family protein [Alphaproteobacteria bacterium]|nr:LemA family protein [Alphaproteobacteria bacterium]
MLLLVVGIPLVIMYAWYVGLIGKKNRALEALSTIDVQLKQRLDLVPNILKIANKFMEHEKSLLTEITALRENASQPYDKNDAASVQAHLKAAGALSGKMGTLMMNVENYPTLKSDQTMLQAMQTYNEVEAQITAARRFYNSSVTELNNAVEIFPGNIIAGMAGVKAMPFFEAEEAARAAVDASQYLK